MDQECRCFKEENNQVDKKKRFELVQHEYCENSDVMKIVMSTIYTAISFPSSKQASENFFK